MDPQAKSNESRPIYNCHTHIFTLNDVPDKFSKGMLLITIPISFLKKSGILRWLIKILPKIIFRYNDGLERMANLVRHTFDPNSNKERSQEEIFNNLQSYYPKHTKFVVLTMDMDYMINGKKCKKENSNFYHQLENLAKMKSKPAYKDLIYPFIHVDPRRLEEQNEEYLDNVKVYVQQKGFAGIKIYPALGYFPFDRRLKDIYDFALEKNLPITTHSMVGTVYFRGCKKELLNTNKFTHPKTNKDLPGKHPKYYTQHFTHPLNYECFFRPDFLAKEWGIREADAIKYQKLKFCFGHYGGSKEWLRFLQDPWIPQQKDSLDLKKWDHRIEKRGLWQYVKSLLSTNQKNSTYSWFSYITDMICKNEDRNLYADISYILWNKDLFPLLKILLETREHLRKHLLLGTDFYVVAQKSAERELTINLRGYLGEELFKQISEINPIDFLKRNP